MQKSALIIIDMQNGFLNENSAQLIKMAADTVPACARAAEAARKRKIPVFFIGRHYRADGTDVEHTRFPSWLAGGRAMSEVCSPQIDDSYLPGLAPKDGDFVLVKPRFSAFFMTPLDLMLRRLGIDEVFLTGTTTPNCIRTTCYDAISLDYSVTVIEDCCSSQTPEIQRANIADMANIGARIISCEDFVSGKSSDRSSLDKCREFARQILK